MISYAPLWKTMELKEATSYTLIYKGGISSASYRRLKAGQSVSSNTFDALCRILNCTLSDIAKYIPDEENAEPDDGAPE